jgi:hypothetical protein
MLINKILNGLQALLVFNITLTEVGTPSDKTTALRLLGTTSPRVRSPWLAAQEARGAKRFALAALAGELATNYGLTGSEGISGRVKFLLLAWAGMPKTNFRKNSDSPLYYLYTYEQDRHSSTQDAYRHRCPYILIFPSFFHNFFKVAIRNAIPDIKENRIKKNVFGKMSTFKTDHNLIL